MVSSISAGRLQEADIRFEVCPKDRKVDGYNFTVTHLDSLDAINELIRLRLEKYKKSGKWIQEFVVNGKLLLTGRGTVQIIYQANICGTRKVPLVMTWREFARVASSIRTEGIKIPKKGDICPRCRKQFNVNEVLAGNILLRDKKQLSLLELKGGKLISHVDCPK